MIRRSVPSAHPNLTATSEPLSTKSDCQPLAVIVTMLPPAQSESIGSISSGAPTKVSFAGRSDKQNSRSIPPSEIIQEILESLRMSGARKVTVRTLPFNVAERTSPPLEPKTTLHTDILVQNVAE